MPQNMKDQADTLRKLMLERSGSKGSSKSGSRKSAKPEARGPEVVTFSSGKGGVGKSCMVANVGSALARLGLKVLLVDGDFGLANLDILLGLSPNISSATVEDVLEGRASLSQTIVGVEPNLWLLPAASGVMDLRFSRSEMRERFAALLEGFPWEMDVVLVDVGAGIHSRVLSLHHPSFRSVIVVTPEPTSITDAYGLAKLVRQKSLVTNIGIVVNQVSDETEAAQVFRRLRDVSDRYIDGLDLEYLGYCVRDEKIARSVMKRKILLDYESDSLAAASFERLARRLRPRGDSARGISEDARDHGLSRVDNEPSHEAMGNAAGFWRTLLGEVRA